MKNTVQALLLILISFNFSACSSTVKQPEVAFEKSDFKLKRSWVRRLSTKKSLRTNEIAQNFNPLVRENGNIIQASSFGGIYELNEYGHKKWSHEAKSPVSGAGSMYKNFVFFGTQDKYLHAYDISGKAILWSTLLEGAVSSISEFENGKIFVLTDLGSLYSIKAAEGIVDWKVSYASRKALKIYGGAMSVLYKDQVIAAFPNGVVASLSQSTGKSKWKSRLEGSQKYEDVDFLSFSNSGFLVAGVFDEALYRLNLENGRVIWQAFEKPVSPLTMFGDDVYFSTANGELVSLGMASGNLKFRRKLFEGLGGKPLFYKDKIAVADSKGPIRILKKDGSAIVSTYDLVSASSAAMALSKDENKFYVLSDKGYFYSFGLRK
ncbi:MAG: PQQ-binding-like beta-propeller repeat protein [Bdellovibrionales bacterium]